MSKYIYTDSDIKSARGNCYRAVCEVHTAQDKLIKYLSSISSDFYMKDIPPYVVRNILMLASNVINCEDEYRRSYKALDRVKCIVNANGIS